MKDFGSTVRFGLSGQRGIRRAPLGASWAHNGPPRCAVIQAQRHVLEVVPLERSATRSGAALSPLAMGDRAAPREGYVLTIQRQKADL